MLLLKFFSAYNLHYTITKIKLDFILFVRIHSSGVSTSAHNKQSQTGGLKPLSAVSVLRVLEGILVLGDFGESGDQIVWVRKECRGTIPFKNDVMGLDFDYRVFPNSGN